MATFVKDVTLEEAVRMSKCISNTSFCWIIHENILKAAPPNKNYTFRSTEVFWRYTHDSFRISANFPYQNSIVDSSKNHYFTSLEALREAYPKLFESKGKFKVIR